MSEFDITTTAEYRLGAAGTYLAAILDTGEPRSAEIARLALIAIGRAPIGLGEIRRRLADLP